MLAAIDQQGRTRQRARASHVTDAVGHILWRAGASQRRVFMRLGKVRFRLFAGDHGDAGGNAHHAHFRRQRLGQHGGRRQQRRLGQGVRQKIRIEIVQFLIQQVDDHGLPAAWGGLIQRLRQQDGSGQVGVHVGVERGE
ncbi:hypothetical protein D3C72_896760 [compost metagenome]